MNAANFVFVGIRNEAVALDAATGDIAWHTRLENGDGYVNVVCDDPRLFAATHGEIFCLDAGTGRKLWHNPLKGLGLGLVTIAVADLVYVGIRDSVVALDLATGYPVWQIQLTGVELVNVLLDEGNLLATTRGEIFCLDPANGSTRWHNTLKGLGAGAATITTNAGRQTGQPTTMAELRRRAQQSD